MNETKVDGIETLFVRHPGYNETCLACPVCGFDCTHTEGAYTRVGCDARDDAVYQGTMPLGVADDRASVIAVHFSCESGHNFALVIQQHKGNNFVRVESLPDGEIGEWSMEQRLLARMRLVENELARVRAGKRRKAV